MSDDLYYRWMAMALLVVLMVCSFAMGMSRGSPIRVTTYKYPEPKEWSAHTLELGIVHAGNLWVCSAGINVRDEFDYVCHGPEAIDRQEFGLYDTRPKAEKAAPPRDDEPTFRNVRWRNVCQRTREG